MMSLSEGSGRHQQGLCGRCGGTAVLHRLRPPSHSTAPVAATGLSSCRPVTAANRGDLPVPREGQGLAALCLLPEAPHLQPGKV